MYIYKQTYDTNSVILFPKIPRGLPIIPGATDQTYTPGQTGHYTCVVTVNGCSSEISNEIYLVMVGINDKKSGNFNIYPIPNDGKFTVTIVCPSNETYSISIFNTLGRNIFEEGDIVVNGTHNKVIDLKPIAQGVYSIVLQSDRNRIEKKILGNK